MFLILEHILMLPHLAYFAVFISMYMVGWLFPNLEEDAFFGETGRHPMHPTVYSPLIIRTMYSSGALYVVRVCSSAVTGSLL